jgi:hypothetical protein
MGFERLLLPPAIIIILNPFTSFYLTMFWGGGLAKIGKLRWADYARNGQYRFTIWQILTRPNPQQKNVHVVKMTKFL